jgi:hypothetical protein
MAALLSVLVQLNYEAVEAGCRYKFSTVWKTFSRFFHGMEEFLTIFPCYGKYFRQFSILWKKCFHAVENSGFGLFMSAPRAHGAVLRWLLSGARGAL